ncbi:hypothetical protein D3C86_2220560 [compost metagenome]
MAKMLRTSSSTTRTVLPASGASRLAPGGEAFRRTSGGALPSGWAASDEASESEGSVATLGAKLTWDG